MMVFLFFNPPRPTAFCSRVQNAVGRGLLLEKQWFFNGFQCFCEVLKP